ncbi:MAG: type V CRISPR-associated protein Cas12a/Cpf1 [Bacteroidales bacterium]|nr:type V CRISPR-associated protein Cas12a/Cpf1 [Candidatus Equimonas enterica]
MEKTYSDLTNLYQLQKTLRFELKPIGNTLDNIERKGIIAQDEQRDKEYKEVKKIIDCYHKQFISMCLGNFKLKLASNGQGDSLEEYVTLASKANRSEKDSKAFEKVQENLRKQIVAAFKSGNTYTDLFKGELIKKHLPLAVTDVKEKQMVENFGKFTTYFTGFHENRKNMYSDEVKSTAIAYRLIHENLPRFIDNMKVFEAVAQTEVAERFVDIEVAFSEYLNVEHISEMFQLDYFSDTLTQAQIEVYNGIIGGRSENDVKIQGLNEYINLYNQQHKERKDRLPFLKPLYKMMLSDRMAVSWLPEEFTRDEEMLTVLNQMLEAIAPVLAPSGDKSLRTLLGNIADYDLAHIYIANNLGLTDISQQMFGQYDVFASAIKDELRKRFPRKKSGKEDDEAYDKRINDAFKSIKSFSIDYLNNLPQPEREDKKLLRVEDYFAKRKNIFEEIEEARDKASDILAGKHKTHLNQSEQDIRLLKKLLDALKGLQRFIKPLLGSGEEIDKDNVFDAKLCAAWDDALVIITPIYNKVRNWLTRKPYSTEKIKLNFENAQLLGGWDENKECDCTAILLRKADKYFLAIMDKKNNHAFDIEELPSEGDCYDKVVYKLLPGANKMLPKVFFSKSRIDEFNPSASLKAAYDAGTHKKGNSFCLSDCHRLIEFFKASIDKHEDWSKFPFQFSNTESYQDISGFYREVEQQGYMIDYRKVSVSFIDNLVNNGKLYLFQIWNKDFSEYSKGTPNMHTLYWKMAFDERNLADVIYKLNGQAEVFYRKRSLDVAKTTIHRANENIANKNSQNEKCESTFEYDIIKNRRFTVDKFQFHVPLTLNFKAVGKENINPAVQNIIREGGIEHIIGIDRGERHLLYLSLIDLKGYIVKQMTLNDIVNEYKGNTYTTKYKDMLAQREVNRTEARETWQKIEDIKNLKEGYLSQVIHIISKMMVDYKAIVVLEDLNMGFMRGRQKIERQVYEKFEKMLIDKLCYYVDKQKEANADGGLLHALQLANKFESFRKLGKQSGCLFYIPAWNTSKIDPVTGFVNLLDTRYENAEKARCFFGKFDSIRYNAAKDWFEFALDYDKFTTKAEGTQTKWLLCTYGTRIDSFRNPQKQNQWDSEEINMTEAFKEAFAEAGIDIHGNLKDAICSLCDKKTSASLLKRFMHLMRLLVQLRNSETGTENDYILSPVADANGNFFDSRRADDTLPKDADANGAYNIARKGLWVVQQIKGCKEGEKPKLSISNKEWLKFVQQKPYLD